MLTSLLALLAIPTCVPAHGDAHAVLERTANVVGLRAVSTKVLELRGSDIVSQDYESDRTSYPPYLSDVQSFQLWYSPSTHVERRSSQSAMAGSAYAGPVVMGTERGTYTARDSVLTPSE